MFNKSLIYFYYIPFLNFVVSISEFLTFGFVGGRDGRDASVNTKHTNYHGFQGVFQSNFYHKCFQRRIITCLFSDELWRTPKPFLNLTQPKISMKMHVKIRKKHMMWCHQPGPSLSVNLKMIMVTIK